MQDKLAAQEIDAALHADGPELMNSLLQRRTPAMAFRLWDPQARMWIGRGDLAVLLMGYYW